MEVATGRENHPVDCILCGRRFEPTDTACGGCGWNPDAVHEPLAGYRPGELVRGRYEVEAPLGTGRLGTVFRATDLDGNTPVAVRVIHPALIPDEEAGRHFLKGVRSLIRVGHPFMNRVLDVNCEGNRYFAVYAFVDGVPLGDLIESRKNQGRSFTVDETVPILMQVAQLFAESELPCHGSLSPRNVVILAEHIKVLDAALACYLPPAAVAHRLSSNRRIRAWTAPELRRGHPPDARADVYACGALLGEMLTQVAFDGRPEIFVEMDPSLPLAVDAVLRRALLADPRGRHADLRELLESLRDSGVPSVVAPVPRPVPRPGPEPEPEQRPAPEPAPAPRAAPRPAPEPPPVAFDDEPLLLEPDPETPKPAPAPARSFDWEDTSEMTMQVSMADVIRAHAEYRGGPRPAESPLPLLRPSRPPPPAPPARSVSTVPPPPARPQADVRPPFVAPPPVKRSATLPPPPLQGAAGYPPQPVIAPRRPQPMRRDSIPPSVFGGERFAPPPAARRADEQPRYAAPPPEVTQEIELDALEPTTGARRREVTQEIDARMIESVDRASLQSAVSKLEQEAIRAERASTEELIKHAVRLDGVDPRFVRAAHAIEAERRGGSAKKAAEIIKEQGAAVDGIDPRLLRAAARLAEAKVSEITNVGPAPTEPAGPEENEDDWRERMAAQAEASVISFIAPPVTDRPHEVRGFPRTVQRRPMGETPAAAGGPPAPPPPRTAGRRREPAARRALYDDSGETDDDSQPTILARTSTLPGPRDQRAAQLRLDRLEAVLPLMIGLLFTAMAALLALAALRG
jgi:serine/threonine-protein kinase